MPARSVTASAGLVMRTPESIEAEASDPGRKSKSPYLDPFSAANNAGVAWEMPFLLRKAGSEIKAGGELYANSVPQGIS